MNASMGTSGFSHYLISSDWGRAFWPDLQDLIKKKNRYFSVLYCNGQRLKKGAGFYYTGTIPTNATIYDLSTLTCVYVSKVYGENLEIKYFLKI